MRRNLIILSIFFIGMILPTLRADVVLSRIFSDHMVLQHGKPIRIWGTADAGELISASLLGEDANTQADAFGKWSLTLPPLAPNANPAELSIRGKNTIILSDILIGDVWIASGQSNMQWPVLKTLNAEEEIAKASYPKVRLFTVTREHAAEPQDIVISKDQWLTCSPETIPLFSGTAYYFAREIARKVDIPLGIIHCSWGGTCVETWMSKDALENSGGYPAIKERWDLLNSTWSARLATFEKRHAQWVKQAKAARLAGNPIPKEPKKPLGPEDRNAPNRVYNAMLHPLLPLSIRGVIWYQGEANAPRPESYKDLFQSLITQWRRDFRQGDFPFYFVQLANFNTSNHYAWLREAQAAALVLPNTGMAVAIDVGEEKNIHPANKQAVGNRLARLALTHVYGEKDIEYSGPVYAGYERRGNTIRLRFKHADGLINKSSSKASFEIAGEDRIFHPATVIVNGSEVLVSSEQVQAPLAVRYAWSSYPPSTLYNSAGLPASPFRTDNWPREQTP